jgi:orotate phosphoribosyltransferase
MLKESDVVKIINYINEISNLPNYIIIDLKYVDNSESRIFPKFLKLSNIKKVFFVNVDTSSLLYGKIIEDFGSISIICKNSVISLCSNEDEISNVLNIYTNTIFITNMEIIRSCVEAKNQLLNSSNVWSNHYVDFKKLFQNPLNTKIILYQLATLTYDNFDQYDALISSSKNGAILANMLGYILNKKVVHYLSIGPIFALSKMNLNSEIRKGKKYLFVGDFLCLGTELKVLNALIANSGAEIIGGIVISSYTKLYEINDKTNILAKIKCIEEINKCNINYDISGEEIKLEDYNGDCNIKEI